MRKIDSTLVRTPGLAHVWGGLVDHVPRVAEPLLSGLFMTPLRKVKRVPRTERLLGYCESRGRRIAVRGCGEGPVVLLVHGWQGHMGQFSEMREQLVSSGYCVVGCDMPAHGESRGRTTSIVEFSQVIADVAQLVGPVSAVVAHSLGGTALSLALSRGLEVGGGVIVAPLISFDYALDEFSKVLGLNAQARELTARATERRVGIKRAELDLLHFRRPHPRLLIIHDRDDQRTRAADSVELSQRWGCPMIETQGLGHSRILSDRYVLEQIRGFVDQLPRPNSSDLETHLSGLPLFQF